MTAVRRYHDGFSMKRRLRSGAAEALMRSGPLAPRLLRNNVVSPTNNGVGGVIDELRRIMDLPDLQVAVTLAQPKSNRKPVLQLMDGRGRCHGWAKIAWNDRTSALVGNEARWLQASPPPPLAIPDLLVDQEVLGRRVVITSGRAPVRRRLRSPHEAPDLSIVKAIAAMGTTGRGPLRGSAWYASVLDVLPAADVDEAAVLHSVLAEYEDLIVDLGAWHGDFTPWNLMTSPAGVYLIDWEFAADEVPVGFDICHFHTQVGVEMMGLDTDAALGHSALRSPADLAILGVDGGQRWPIWRLYLVELVRRFLALRAQGYPTDDVHQGPAALRKLAGRAPSLNLATP